ncbi:MAG: DUF4340 domain-containing protein [Candidatus Aminicenantia bacterium]
MRPRTTIFLLILFIVLSVLVYFLEFKTEQKEKEEKLIELSSDKITKISFQKKDEPLVFERDKNNEWKITSPLQVKADQYEVNRLAEDFSVLKIERVVEENPRNLASYQIPSQEITLWSKEKPQPIVLQIGMVNPLDQTLYAKRKDEKRVVLIPSHLKTIIDKSLFDFREKEIFEFDKEDIGKIAVQGKDFSWLAVKRRNEEWFFETPVKSLIKKGKIDDLLYTLSNLRAKKFISEQKTAEEIKKHGLSEPDFKITLTLPLENKEFSFLLNKQNDTFYVTTTLSPKIITADDFILTDLNKRPEELREKNIAVFYSFEVKKLKLKKEGKEFLLEKDKEDNWNFIQPKKSKADNGKIENFIRKIEGLETKEFIDPPFEIRQYGLDKPQGEVTIWTEEDNKLRKTTLLIGSENKEKKQVFIKDVRLPYVFLVDSPFLEEFPKEIKDWKEES